MYVRKAYENEHVSKRKIKDFSEKIEEERTLK